MNKIVPFLLLFTFNFSSSFGQSKDSLQQKFEKIQSNDTTVQYQAIGRIVDSLRWAEYIVEERRQEILREERERKEEMLRSEKLLTEMILLDSLLGAEKFKEINELSNSGFFREIYIESDSMSVGNEIAVNGFKYVDIEKQLNDTTLENINKKYQFLFYPKVEIAKSIQLPSINDHSNDLQQYSKSLLDALQYVFTNHSSELKMTFSEYQKLEKKKKIPSKPVEAQIKYRHAILKICLNEIKS